MSNSIDFFYVNLDDNSIILEEGVKELTDSVLKIYGKDNWELSVTFCDDSHIRQLNKDYRKKDDPTDILTFSMKDDSVPQSVLADLDVFTAGDIVISLNSVKMNSQDQNVSFEEELRRVLIHGSLHLLGMKHPKEDYNFESEMLSIQEKLVSDLQEVKLLKINEN